ncbi:unnamed protein product, partial [Gulo gulo]
FQPSPSRAAPARKGGRKGRPAVNGVVTGEHSITIHRRVHRVGFRKRTLRALKECHERDENSRYAHSCHVQQSHLGQRNKECSIPSRCAVVQKTPRERRITKQAL